MAEVPDKAILSEWLRTARRSQTRPDGTKWTYGFLFDRMREDIGWAPSHPNYSAYENAKGSMQWPTYEKFLTFWQGRGVPGPQEPGAAAAAAGGPASPELADYLARIDTLIEQNGVLIELLSQVVSSDPRLAGAVAEGMARGLARGHEGRGLREQSPRQRPLSTEAERS